MLFSLTILCIAGSKINAASGALDPTRCYHNVKVAMLRLLLQYTLSCKLFDSAHFDASCKTFDSNSIHHWD